MQNEKAGMAASRPGPHQFTVTQQNRLESLSLAALLVSRAIEARRFETGEPPEMFGTMVVQEAEKFYQYLMQDEPT